MASAPTQPGLAARLRDVVVMVRGELDVSRHVFRSGPAYVIRDPITFGTHRFDPEDYRVIVAIRRERTLGETFDALVEEGDLEPTDEESFYAFILDLHQRSLLSLPINDAEALYRRYERRLRAEHLSRIMGIFFLRVPLVNPDRFLARTLPLFRWLFTTQAFVGWAILALASAGLAISRLDDLTTPALALLDGGNVLMMLGALIGLKVIHEFGHAYACKSFGGHVPEMGAFFVLFTPMAYVDATDSWTFTSTRQRAIVTLGGVYFESFIGWIALFVWAMTDASTLNTLAYQVVVLSTVTTAMFNLNPLMRYDAYYLVSDLSGVPNFRARCQEAVAGWSKRILFGVRTSLNGEPITGSAGLTAFGLAQITYRLTLLLTISTVLVMKFGGAGIVMAIVMLGMTAVRSCLGLARYVLASEEVAPVRLRAITVTLGLVIAGLGAGSLVPVSWPVHARGVVTFEQVAILRAPIGGTVVDLPARSGDEVREGQLLVGLSNADLEGEHRRLLADREAIEARTILASTRSPSEGMLEQVEFRRVEAHLARSGQDLSSLLVRAPHDGRVLDTPIDRAGGRVKQGDPLMTYAWGKAEAVFHVRAFEFESMTIAVGDEITCRSPTAPDRAIVGRVVSLGAVGWREVDERVRHMAPMGLVPLDPSTGLAIDPYFEVRLQLTAEDASLVGAGLRARFPTRPRTTAQVLERRIERFLQRMKE
ncbi:MAG: HlyD family efflux transporter periplasmic adaptor subunit [Phycisphaerales bacterium]|nr:HlyD family efflux transporter periplasmic adaptor subunit [Phycisphaerales bacterium]